MKLKKAVLVFATIGVLCSQGALLKNGDFEIGTLPGADGWTMCPHYRVEESAGRNGSRGLIVENSDPNAMSGEFCGQFVEAKPGFKYKFSGWVKCENVTGHAKDTGIKARVLVLVFVFDAKGKGLGEYYTEFKAGTVSDWTRIEGETPPLPATAARLQVNPFVWHNATGRAWFDDISIEQVESIPVRGLYSSAYRDLAWEGFVKFSAVLGIDTAAMPLDTLVAEFVYSTGNYTCKRVSAETFTATLAQATIPVANLPMGKCPVSFELRRKDGRKLISEIPLMFTRTAVPPKRKIWIDSRNRLIVGGRPFFPLGFYGTMIDEKYISKMDGTPFNCYMPYRYLGTNEFNIAAKHGLWIIANMKDFIPGKGGTPCCKVLETNGEADRGLICRFHALKDYPKLLCWYMNDESSVEQIERLTRQYRYVRENDPDHPVWAVLFQHDQVREYMGTCDVVGNDDYPIGLRPIETVSRYARETVDGFLGGPCWHVPQAINWKHYLKTGNTENFRMPTLEEARSMSWQYIANGGNGLIYYTFERLIDEGGRFWENYCTVAREVKSLESILLAEPAPNATGYPPLMGGRAWTQDGRLYLLLVNENETPRSADLKLASRYASVKAMNTLPSKARISLDGDKLHVEMEPIGVVMLELDPDAHMTEPREKIPDNSHAERRDSVVESGPYGDHWWRNRFHNHLQQIAHMKGGTVDLALIGDSITHFWELKHPSSWMALTNRYSAINLGYGGDRTQDVLWRIMNGELDGYRAKVVMLMIGTNNNAASDSRPENVARGVERIIEVIREKQPQAKIILLPIFPRGSKAEWTIKYHAEAHRRNIATNPLIRKLADGKRVFWLDFNSRLSDADGHVPYDIMNDAIHPTDKGYAIWMEALSPLLNRLLRVGAMNPDQAMQELDPDDQQKGQMKLACQMWGVKEFWEKDPEKGFAEVFPRVKAMGYEGVQSMAFWNIDHDRLEALLKANGLAVADMPITFDYVEGTNIARTIVFCRRFDVDFVYIPWFGGKTAAEWRAFCNRLAAAGKRLASYGIRIGYHNHIHEFTKPLDGEYPAEILKADRHVNLELDIGPVTESGNDAVKWIADLSGRIPGLHAKPHGATAVGAPGDVQAWPKIVHAARKAGVKWFVVECEQRKDTYDDVAASAAYLKPLLGSRQCADKSCCRSPR